MKIEGLESIRKAIGLHTRDMRAAMTMATDKSAELLLEEMKFLVSRIDHDLKQLQKMGHPYAAGKPQGQPHPDWIVHVQSGELVGGLSVLPASVTGQQIEAQILSQARHTWFLLLGTRKMRPRDFVSAAIIKRRVEIEAMYLRAFLEQLDTQQVNGYRTHVSLIPHPDQAAQLPGG